MELANRYVLSVENSLPFIQLQLQKTSHVGYGCGALEDNRPTFGANLSRLMKRSGVRATDVAADLGVVKSAVSGWRHDKVELPNTLTLLRLAKSVRCTVDELLAGLDQDYETVKRDLIRQSGDQGSGLPQHLGAQSNDTTAAGLDEPALTALIGRFTKDAREVLRLSDSLNKVAIRLEETRTAAKEATDRSRRHRKTG